MITKAVKHSALLMLVLLGCSTLSLQAAPQRQDATAQPTTRFKILHIMSYHSPWRWTDDQFDGFKDGLGVKSVEFKVFQMNTKVESSAQSKHLKAQEAINLINTWQPDLVYTTDDDAQELVTSHFINSNIPFVFSGVNHKPETYGFTESNNITGVVEVEHFVESIKLLQAISPQVKRLAVVFDDAPMWHPIQQRMAKASAQISTVEHVDWDTITTYEQFQKKVTQYQATVDAIVLAGIFNFKDVNGANVPYQEVLQWVADHSDIPDIGFWMDRVHYGTLAAVTVSGREQGLAAGQMAREILVNGKSPANIPIIATTKGIPVINLARARRLNLRIKSSLLLSSQVIDKFEWEP